MSGKKGRSGAKKSTRVFPLAEAIKLREEGLSLVKIGRKIHFTQARVAAELKNIQVHYVPNPMFLSVRACGTQESDSPKALGTHDWKKVTCPQCRLEKSEAQWYALNSQGDHDAARTTT